MANNLNNISPLDGRYANSVSELGAYFSEMALMRYRLKVELEYLIALGNEKGVDELVPFSESEQVKLRKIYDSFDMKGADRVKALEAITNHDVKAIEYYLRERLERMRMKRLLPWIHFALTSEDINNLAYTLMWQGALKEVYSPTLVSIHKKLKGLAKRYASAPMLALTHGQPATPTTFGKELAVFTVRLQRQMDQLKSHRLQGKFGGATGTWSAQIIAYPKVNWIRFATKYIKALGLEPNLITTQIEPHDSAAESYHLVIRINSILTDLCRDLWLYISRGVLGQKKVAREVGSSTMPHKINPIQFENAEGNMGISTALLNHLSVKLPISRMQRDLTDSTTLRNQGVALGHSFLALKNILKGLERLTINKTNMGAELDNHWEVLAEAVQTILRKAGQADAYDQLKEMTRGRDITQAAISDFVSSLKISSEDKQTLIKLTPADYTGLAQKLVDLI